MPSEKEMLRSELAQANEDFFWAHLLVFTVISPKQLAPFKPRFRAECNEYVALSLAGRDREAGEVLKAAKEKFRAIPVEEIRTDLRSAPSPRRSVTTQTQSFEPSSSNSAVTLVVVLVILAGIIFLVWKFVF